MTKVLVTGVTGFIGYSLSEKLLEKGYDVWGAARFSAQTRRIPDGVKAYQCDITDPYSVTRMVKDIRPDIIVHLAAMTPVSLSYNMPKYYMEVNYYGTVNLVEAARRIENLKAFIYASTSETYGQQEKFPLVESMNRQPNTPYSISKYAGELYVRVYAREAFDFPSVVAIPFNTYGRAKVGQKHFVIEKIICNMLKGVDKLYLGDPDVVRDFMFREDHVNAYLKIVEAVENGKEEIYGEAFNFATGRGVTIRELVKIISKIIGWDGEIIWYTHVRPADIRKLIGDYSKAKRILGWEPKYSLEEGLRKAIKEWSDALTTPIY